MPLWLLFAFVSGLLYTGQNLLTRHVLRFQKDAWAFSFYFSLIGALVSFPFMLFSPTVPKSWVAWLLTAVVGFLIVSQNLLNFKSSNFLEASLSGAITKFRLVWVFVLSIILLHEGFSIEKLLGTLFTIAAGLLIINKIKRPKSLYGVGVAFGATLFYAIVIILYKYLFTYFNSVSLTFFVTFLPAVIINFIIMPHAFSRIISLFKTDGLLVTIACALGAGANLALNSALAAGQASEVLVIVEAFLVFTLVGEHIFLKEKEHLYIKIAAVVLAVIGAILIRLSK